MIENIENKVDPKYTIAALAYALYERRQETALRTAFVGLLTERHEKFHDPAIPVERCRNEHCVEGMRVVNEGRKPELVITELSMELIAKYQVTFRALKSSDDNRVVKVIVELVERGSVQRAPIVAMVEGQ